MIEQTCERLRLIVRRNARKCAAGLRSGRIATAAQVVEAQDPMMTGIERASRPHDLAPTAATPIGRIEQPPVAPDSSHGAHHRRIFRTREPPRNPRARQLSAMMQSPGARDLEQAFSCRGIGRRCSPGKGRLWHHGGVARVIHECLSARRIAGHLGPNVPGPQSQRAGARELCRSLLRLYCGKLDTGSVPRLGEAVQDLNNPHNLASDPIPSDWVLEGSPVARSKLLVGSSDDMASTHMWDCTAGRFNWFYTVDEVIHVLEGTVIIEDAAGERRQLCPGDTFLFPAGTRFHWTVPLYIRKLAFLHSPLSRKLRLAKRVFRILTSPFRRSAPLASGFRT